MRKRKKGVWVHDNAISLLVILVLDERGGDTVEVTLSLLGDASSTVVVDLEHAELLERLDDLPLDGAGAVAVVGRSVATVDGGTVELLESADADRLAEVDVSRDGSRSNVVPIMTKKAGKPSYSLSYKKSRAHSPVGVVWGKLLGSAGLDRVHPRRHLELTRALQEGGVGLDELVGGHVPHCSSWHGCVMYSITIGVVVLTSVVAT